MSVLTKLAKVCANVLARPFGYGPAAAQATGQAPLLRPEEFDVPGVEGRDEAFADYLRSANAAGMDLNDWLEHEGWTVNAHVLERSTVRFLRPSSAVLELGAGSGRFSRYVVRYLTGGQLHLVDHSPWKVNFLTRYFAHDSRIRVHLNEGLRLPPEIAAESLDLVCTYSTFTYLRLGEIWRFAQEFARVLRPGGHCTFDYQDISTAAGWNWLEQYSSPDYAGCFSYFTPPMLERVFHEAGFAPVPDCPHFEDYSYLVFRKNETSVSRGAEDDGTAGLRFAPGGAAPSAKRKPEMKSPEECLNPCLQPDSVVLHFDDTSSLTNLDAASLDLIYSFGNFIYRQLGEFYCCGKEFLRVLRPGGHVVLNFLDLDTEAGWKWLKEHADDEGAACFTYFTADVIEELFKHVGFEIARSREYLADFHYLVLRKPRVE